MRKSIAPLVVCLILALGAVMALTRPALADSGCTVNFQRICQVLDGGEICYPTPSGERCDPIIIEIPGVRNEQ